MDLSATRTVREGSVYEAIAEGRRVTMTSGFTIRAQPAPSAIARIIDELRREQEGVATLSVSPDPDYVPLVMSLGNSQRRERVQLRCERCLRR